MKNLFQQVTSSIQTKSALIMTLAAAMIAFSSNSFAHSDSSLIDDFSHDVNSNTGFPRQFLDDKVMGGKTHTELKVKNGIMNLTGEIEPPRGQLGWASTVLLLNTEGKAIDASQYDGIRLLVKINKGSLSLSANSTDITNFDYHSSVVTAAADGKYHEVKVPFSTMQRAWSEQTELNTQTINSISIVAFGLQKAPFDYEIDEVSFY